MKTVVVIEVDHRKEIPHLADMIAGRAYTIDGVSDAEVLEVESKTAKPLSVDQLQARGFTLAEIALGLQEVCR